MISSTVLHHATLRSKKDPQKSELVFDAQNQNKNMRKTNFKMVQRQNEKGKLLMVGNQQTEMQEKKVTNPFSGCFLTNARLRLAAE